MRRWLLPILFGPLLVACRKEAKVYVECQGVGTGFNCTATHRSGEAKAKACWDVNVRCQNGALATASACQTVSPDQKAGTFIPLSAVKNAQACDLATSTTVENLVITLLE